MAAKQGTLAQLSQAGEDAKRAVLSRTGVTSSWFSNLNTVCTIKSAPPRSPEVLQMLATKSGWLFKRNEQHVWQVRWCCAVPHTFLYYFDANIVPSSGAGGTPILTQPTLQQQEEWNRAVAVGYGNRKQHEKRSNFYLFNHNNTTSTPDTNSSHPPPNTAAVSYNNAEGDENSGAEFKEADLTNSNFSANMQPAGIIDLECYTSIHRSSANSNILELAGDDQVNPDLRGFYFCASSPSECEDWTDALLNGRHSALQDECEAYKQVCDGFAQQLQLLHNDIDEATRAQEEADSELYRVRSQMEELRRTVRRMVEDSFDRTLVPPIAQTGSNISGFQDEWKSEIEGMSSAFPNFGSMDDDNPILAKRLEFTCNLETIQSQDMGVPALVRVLAEYCSFLEDSSMQLLAEKSALAKQLKQTGQSDQQRVHELELELETMKRQKEMEINSYKESFETLQGKYQQSQKELQDVQNDLSSTRMEITMYQTQQRTKLAELQQHKKILKKEVLELRNSLEEKDARIRQFQISHETDKLTIEQEKSTNKLLERYITKIESQVHVQQNMMEMMSQSGMGSVFGGGGGGSVYGGITGHKEPTFIQNSRSPKSSHTSPLDTHSRNEMGRRETDCDRNIRDNENDPHDAHDDTGSNQDDQTDDLGDVANHLLRPVDTSFAANSSHRTAHRGNRRGHDAKQTNQKTQKFHSPQRQKQQHMMIDQDSDNKSHVSELTEDRTQRHFDAFNHYATSAAAQHGLTSPRTFDIVHNEFAAKKRNGISPRVGPPLHIIGVNKNSNSIRNQDEDNDDDESPDDIDESDHQRFNLHSGYTRTVSNMLDTINCGSTSASLPPIGNSILSTPTGRLDIPRGGVAGSVASRGGSSGKVSVAQRARLEADYQSSLVRVNGEDQSKSMSASPNGILSLTPPKLQGSTKHEGDHNRHSLENTTSSSFQSSNSQVSHSLPSGLWKRVEEAVLGSRSDDDDSLASRGSSSTSESDNQDNARREITHGQESTHKMPQRNKAIANSHKEIKGADTTRPVSFPSEIFYTKQILRGPSHVILLADVTRAISTTARKTTMFSP
jgi:hypothetical protein